MKNRLLILLSFVLLSTSLIAQVKQLRYENFIYEQEIKTVTFFQAGSPDPSPVINLTGGSPLELRFDQMGTANEFFQFTLVHCDVNWNPTKLNKMEYLGGQQFDNITEFWFSGGSTYTRYVHYRAFVPSQNMRPLISGNYLLIVYRNFNESDVIITRRFMVVNSFARLNATVKPASNPQGRFSQQEVDVIANLKNYNVINPMTDLNLVIMQNLRWDNLKKDIRPRFITGNEYNFDYEDINVFDGSNEFRFFDIRSMRFLSPNVGKKEMEGDLIKMFLLPTEPRFHQKYAFYNDFNGRRLIENRDGGNPFFQADYAMTYFTYKPPGKLTGSDVYLLGEFTDWRPSEEFRMKWNAATQAYETFTFLKQAYYSYLIVTTEEYAGEYALMETTLTEGNFFETENDYYIFLYVRNNMLDYDELIGFQRINTENIGRR